MKLLRFGKGPVPVKKANACEAVAFWERPGDCVEAESQRSSTECRPWASRTPAHSQWQHLAPR